MTAINRDLAARVAELGIPLTADRPVLRNSSVIPLPSNWSCAYGASDDEPFCTDEGDEHVCPTIRVHRDDAEQFAALVARVHELEGELAATSEPDETEFGVRAKYSSDVWPRREFRTVHWERALNDGGVLVQRTIRRGPWTEVPGCPGFEGNPVAPDLCAGCHEPREDHEEATS